MINPAYANLTKEIRNVFSEEKMVTLADFLEHDSFKNLSKSISKLKFMPKKEPMHHSFTFCSLADSPLQHPVVLAFIGSIINKKVKRLRLRAFTFVWKDFTLLHDAHLEKPGLDIIFDFGWNQEWGGEVFYVDGTGAYRAVPPTKNTLTIVQRSAKLHRFVKYVNNHAEKHKHYLLIGCLDI